MAEVLKAEHEFWRPPIEPAVSDDATARHELSEACPRCGTEFIVGSRFCHTCGSARPGVNPVSQTLEIPGIAEITASAEKLGLSTAAFIAFVLGTLCIVAGLAVGVIFSAKTALDWQAIQIWRIEWLLAAISAFVAGSLLNKKKS